MGKRSIILLISVAISLLATTVLADYRPGGGQTYSGGGSGGGSGYSGNGDGGGEIVYLLIHLCVRYPYIGIPLTIVAIIIYLKWFRHDRRTLQNWDSGNSHTPFSHEAVQVRDSSHEEEWRQLRRLDPDFSKILFEDFVYKLFAQAHKARGIDGGLSQLGAYLSSSAKNYLAHTPPTQALVTHVVIGAIHIRNVEIPQVSPTNQESPDTFPQVRIRIQFEANLTAQAANGSTQSEYRVENWTLVRAANVHSRPPEFVHSFHCPSCGAPFVSSDAAHCDRCGADIRGGRFDWQVETIHLVDMQHKPPLLTQTVEEVGTDLPTIFQADVASQWAALTSDDPQLTSEALGLRIERIYQELNQAWMDRNLQTARPYISDGMYEYLQYWIDAYLQQGLRNMLEKMQLTRIQRVKVIRDKSFDAVTVRIFAQGRDYTVDERSGKKVSGNRHRDREYSEYWTLIRGRQARGTPRTDKQCPNCGAPLKISMGGNCEYCSAHITSGEFDWILSKIEQDEAYSG